ncbi:thioredoxin [Candidatus Poribacteria bacterium]|nr:MAG: thioredoxin [Candidatus Poribacteria bacterium]
MLSVTIGIKQFSWKKFLGGILLLNIAWIVSADEAALKNPDGSWKWTNRLIDETSPYLLLHAHNPVEWYPWGDEAVALAKKENKIIFLSVGYSTCYWCHVMERKVFSNPEIAAMMNKNFINIKIDREERPDLDEIYMTATQLLIQRGGWPNSVFLTPDLKPFYAGTYFPPTDMPGRPGFPTILDAVHEAWVTREVEVIDSANQISNTIDMAISRGFTALSARALDRTITTAALDYLRTAYSHAYGGFGTAPKFPSPANLEFLLSEYQRESGLQTAPTKDESLLKMVTRTLDMMAYGGMYDQVGGGFHRYSVDAKWLIPHFEKMLYDNAQLAKLYLQAYQLTQAPRYRRVAEEIFNFIFREMTAPEGGFYSALDAETDAEEGKYYVWTADEIRKVLGKKDAARFADVYGVDKGPNFEGHSVLYVPEGAAAEASVKDLSKAREKLLAVRTKREYPLLDTKIIVNWNGLMIDALAYGYHVLGEERYLSAASKAAQFILDTMTKPDGELCHTYTAGVVKQDTYLDDYAFFVRGLLRLYQATGDEQWLDSAKTLTDRMIQLFWDNKNGGFFYTKADAKHLIVRTKKPYDSAIPSGNAVAVKNLLALGADYRHYAEKTLRSFAESMAQSPSSFMYMHFALNDYLISAENFEPPSDAVVAAIAKVKGQSDDIFNIELQLKIAAGWHINANPAGQDYLIPTTVELDANASVEIVDIVYPKGKSTRFEFSDEPLNVYEGNFTIPLRLKQRPNVTRKENTPIILKLTYQPCNDTECLFPETLDISLELP